VFVELRDRRRKMQQTPHLQQKMQTMRPRASAPAAPFEIASREDATTSADDPRDTNTLVNKTLRISHAIEDKTAAFTPRHSFG